MPRTAKRLLQTALSGTAATVYTAPASTTAQVTEIYLANTGTTARTVTLYVNGTANSNIIVNGLLIAGGGSVILQDTKIVIPTGTVLSAKQDTGTDIICTVFGIEEV
jgi:hypothetical protein